MAVACKGPGTPAPGPRTASGKLVGKETLAKIAERAASRCIVCKGEPPGIRRKFCSKRCTIRSKRTPRIEKPCVECGVPFITAFGRERFCTRRCNKRYYDRIKTSRRRAAARVGEDISHIVVFERDGWRCQICKRKTPRELIGLQVPRSPELDHIVPLSQGGAHTYANVQCLCHDCNMEKGATVYGQLRLFE